MDGILSQQGGFQVSKRDQKGESKKARGLRHNCIVRIYMYIMIACNCLNDCQSVYVCIIIVRYKCS